MKKHKSLNSVLCLLQLFIISGSGNTFEPNSHAAISQRAVDASNLNNFLTSVLSSDFPIGVSQQLRLGDNGIVRDLIAEVGAKREDEPAIRSRFHFHDPTQPWNNAGLRWPIVGQVAESSVLWGQNQDQGLSGKHSWHDARQSYFNALTAADPEERKRLFAEIFESLGHVMHLVQDAATPSHLARWCQTCLS